MDIHAEKYFSREIASVGQLLDFISQVLANGRIDADAGFALMLVIEEVFTNLVKYEPDGIGDIPLRVMIRDDRITATLINCGGSAFVPDWSTVVDRDMPLQQRKCGGLGLHLVRGMVDDVRYEYRDGNGIITIVKLREDRSA